MLHYSQKKIPILARYWGGAGSFFGVYILIIFSQLEWVAHLDFINQVFLVMSSFDLFFFELLLVLLMGGVLLRQGSLLSRFFAYVIIFFYSIITLLQTASFYQTGKFVTKLAAENINHLIIILNTKNITLLLMFLLLFLAFVIVTEVKKVKYSSQKGVFSAFLAILILLALIASSNIFSWWSESKLIERNSFLVNNQLRHQPPIISMYKTLFSNSVVETREVNRSKNILVAKQYGFSYKKQLEYPLLKQKIYEGKPPFSYRNTSSKGMTTPNVIVFFTEGFSARTSNVYGSEYERITPNLVDFAKQSMVVDNYYNHTAATYRGLHGQLCSIYPKYGGYGGGWQDNYHNLPKVDYFCLPQLFSNYGYQSIFLHSQKKSATNLDSMMEVLKFDTVWTADTLRHQYLKDEPLVRDYALSDHQYFTSLVSSLKDMEKDKKPFFMSVYNFETHAFLDVLEDGKRYGNGRNISLNTIHNLDDAFGQFWKYYQQSALASNTIVIFTSDHSHYHEKPYVEAVDKPGSGYQKLFVDKIPLIIHDPTRMLPPRYDAEYASSIDLAPSLIHYLGLANHQNAFMGRSIFEDRDKPTGVASIGGDTFVINKDKIHGGGGEYSGEYQSDVENLRGFIAHTQWLEVQNRVWDTKLDRVIKQKANTHFFDRRSTH